MIQQRVHAEPIYTPEDYAIFFQRGRELGLNYFFREFYPALHFYAYKIITDKPAAEEIASDAFVKIWQRHKQFQDPLSIKKYLYRIVRNDALKWAKKNKIRQVDEQELLRYHSSTEEKDHFNRLVEAETIRQLHTSLNGLPPYCGKVIKLLYVEGKSVKEIADELNISKSTVKTQKARGIKLLRKSLIKIFSMLSITPFLQMIFCLPSY